MYKEWSLLGIFSCLDLFFHVFEQVKKEVVYIRIAWNDKSVTCSCVANYFYFALWSWSAWRSTQTYYFQFLTIFNHCDLFPQNFGRFVAQIILFLIKTLRLCCIVTSSMLFILLWDQVREEGVLKLMRNGEIEAFLAFSRSFSPFWGAGQEAADIRFAWNK